MAFTTSLAAALGAVTGCFRRKREPSQKDRDMEQKEKDAEEGRVSGDAEKQKGDELPQVVVDAAEADVATKHGEDGKKSHETTKEQ